MRVSLITRILLLMMVIFSSSVTANHFIDDPAWIKQEPPMTNVSTPFLEITIPSSFLTLYPDYGNYPLYEPFIDSKYIPICSYTPSIIITTHLSNISCTDLFCNTNYSYIIHDLIESMFNNTTTNQESHQLLFSLLHNYCFYCARTDFVQFHSLLRTNQCESFVFTEYDRNRAELCLSNGYPLIHYDILNDPNDPWMCYCPWFQQFGYMCDVITYVMIPMHFLYLPFTMVFLIALVMLVSVVLLVIPIMVFHHHTGCGGGYCCCGGGYCGGYCCCDDGGDCCCGDDGDCGDNQRNSNNSNHLEQLVQSAAIPSTLSDDDESSNRSHNWLQLCSSSCSTAIVLKSLSTLFFMLSLCLILPQSILGTAFASIWASSSNSINLIRSWCQYLSTYMLCLSLSFILLLWVRIVHGRPFSLVQHVVIVCVYVSQVVSLVALSIARQVIGGTALAVVHAMVIPLYFVVFAIGLVIFGCRMYSDLQRIAQVMMRREKFVWSNLKFMRFTILIAVLILSMALLSIFMACMLIAWDIFSKWVYLLIPFVYSACTLVTSLVLINLLFSLDHFKRTYCCCCVNKQSGQWIKQEEDCVQNTTTGNVQEQQEPWNDKSAALFYYYSSSSLSSSLLEDEHPSSASPASAPTTTHLGTSLSSSVVIGGGPQHLSTVDVPWNNSPTTSPVNHEQQ